MAKVSSVQKNIKRKNLARKFDNKRNKLKTKIYDKSVTLDERFSLIMKLASLPRNSALTRVRNRCAVTGRPRGFYRKFLLSRNMLRDLAGQGFIPGLVKASW